MTATAQLSTDVEAQYQIFKFTDYNNNNYEAHVDPDNNYYNGIVQTCKYHTEQQFNVTYNRHSTSKLSIIHFNARSLKANFD